jgi:hypothetical protein
LEKKVEKSSSLPGTDDSEDILSENNKVTYHEKTKIALD